MNAIIAKLLRDAEKAHAAYEKAFPGGNQEWPEFYASFIVQQIRTFFYD